MIIHVIRIDGEKYCYEFTPAGDYGERIEPSAISQNDRITEEVELYTEAISNALFEIEDREEVRILWDYIIFLERLLGKKLTIWPIKEQKGGN